VARGWRPKTPLELLIDQRRDKKVFFSLPVDQNWIQISLRQVPSYLFIFHVTLFTGGKK
jgi:hypothetical protein